MPYTIIVRKESYARIGVDLTPEQIEKLERMGVASFDGLAPAIIASIEKLDEQNYILWHEERPEIVYYDDSNENSMTIIGQKELEDYQKEYDDDDEGDYESDDDE